MFSLKDEDLIMVDTCTISNILNGKWKREEKEAFDSLISIDTKLCISDLTFSELVNGKTNLEEYNQLIDDLTKCEIMIYSLNTSYDNYLQKYLKPQPANQDFLKIKESFNNLKIEACMGIFPLIVIKYLVLLYGLSKLYILM